VGPDVQSGLSGLPAVGPFLRLQLHVAASVQRVGIGPCGTVRHQSIFCERASARRLLAASPRLLNWPMPACKLERRLQHGIRDDVAGRSRAPALLIVAVQPFGVSALAWI
jgi:hypothetical protein